VEANVHSTPEDLAMGHQKWSSETLKDMEMNVYVTRDPLYDAVLVAREKEIKEETLWVIETAFEAAGVIHCQIYAM
jgi:hypothetical protein